ncbi:hypothetical protein FPV16_17455 [Methylobacterium sp. W2]|nr:hypothetical protein [Methylobacterium sp. W2]
MGSEPSASREVDDVGCWPLKACLRCLSKALPLPEVPRSGLEGAFRGSPWCLERSLKALCSSKAHLRMGWSAGMINSA